MREAGPDQVSDLIEVDLGPGARGYFTTRGLQRISPLGGHDGHARARSLDGRGASVYEGWNLALHVGDDPQRVHRHRRRLEDLLGLDRDQHLAWMNQVHSSVVAAARAEQVPTADALVLDSRVAGAPRRMLRPRGRLRAAPPVLSRRQPGGGCPCRASRHARRHRPRNDQRPAGRRGGSC